MFNKYYESELHKLREQAVGFAKEHPLTAPLLLGPSMDPSAERILEGVAFLSGLLEHKLDDEFKKFIQEIIEIIYPPFIRPTPSMSIVLFEPKVRQKDPVIVRSGTLLNATQIDGTICPFQTTFDVEVNPLRTISAHTTQINSKIIQLEVTLELLGTELNRWQPQQGLYFFLGGTYTSATAIFMLLSHYLKRIILKSELDKNIQYILPPNALKPIGLDIDDSLLEFSVQSFSVFKLLQDYFVFPQKSLFMALTGLDKWVEGKNGSIFSICFELEDIPVEIVQVNQDTFIFNAVPVINLFDYAMEPISLDHKTDKILLRPNFQYPDHYQVYEVTSVIGSQEGGQLSKEYRSLSGVRGIESIESGQNAYQLIRDRSIINDAPEAFLFFPYQDSLTNLSTETLTIMLKCTNGRLPDKLRVGDICKPTHTSPEALDFRNILRPTCSIESPSDATNLWRFMSNLSLNFLSITNINNLKNLLRLYISNEDPDKPRMIANQKRISGITSVTTTTVDRIYRGRIMTGQRIEMDVNMDQFAGLGDVYLFGTIMERFFTTYASINTFTQFNLKEIETGVSFKWTAKVGNRALI